MVGLGIIATFFAILFKIRYENSDDYLKAEGEKRKN
jgi:hypothetical protein